MVAASGCESYGILRALHAPTNATALHRDCRPQRCRQTTFAREYLPKVAGLIQFVNADLIAEGLASAPPSLPYEGLPRGDVLRRFDRGWQNFLRVYRPLADIWTVYDNSGASPQLVERSP
jgi:predicted ABC-type ATPase